MNGFRIFRFLLIAGIAAGWSATALADKHRIEPPVEIPVIPEEYASVRDQLTTCFECHGVSGASPDPGFPILSGQHYYYLYVQLKDFSTGLRTSDVMQTMTADLDKDQMKLLAKYFSEQKWPNTGFRGDPEIAARGQTATNAGQCVQCHRGGYEGDSRVPRLAGQYREYLLQTMSDFKNKVRMNSPAKSSLMASFEDSDLDAMAEYLADF